ncbi:MAG: NAD(P)/FAD-dependent oxidoreductase, partial [Pseudomonadota bacterium]
MAGETIETDYLIVGCGAVGMAFADVVLSETEADIVIVDRHHMPGGHWNDAYSFVTLHQPSAFYGVSSMELSSGRKDEVGLNKGLHELASGAEVSAYFDKAMRQRFLPSGRVRYFPSCDYIGDWSRTGRFRSLLTGKETEVTVRAKTVDGTYFNTTVPSTHTPNFEIEPGATLRPLNDLPKLTERPDGFTVVGGGKTAIDAVLWLLERVEPDMIRWIKPRDGWLINRANTQPTEEFFANTIGAQAAQMEAAAAATDVDDLFRRLEEAKVLLRIYPDVKPSMYHGATISEAEVDALRAVTNVVRLGRVTRLGLHEIELERGSILTTPGTFHVDCSARAVPGAEIVPVFTEDRITVQTVRTIQPVFSAAFIAHVEVAYETVKEKNRLCQVVPIPNHDTDWMRVTAALMMNQMAWSKDDGIRAWLEANRLDGFTAMVRAVDEWD